MQPFTRRVIEVISSIPTGRVMSYGQVAAAAGSPRAARQVVRVLHSMSAAYHLPWHRVINKQGEISIQDDESAFEQRTRLEEEGVEFTLDGRVQLERFTYDVDDMEQTDHTEQEQENTC
ncbi:MGMT family protein [Paenibacillus sp. WLX2291]|uniref:MGMT family protein n=1 Tax=Paenibacillus sp. WLX2291 TaxID=3296934 RepID=UPI0039841622